MPIARYGLQGGPSPLANARRQHPEDLGWEPLRDIAPSVLSSRILGAGRLQVVRPSGGKLQGWIVSLAGSQYSYACVLIAAAIDAMALPFPGRLVLLSAGILAAAGRVDLLGTIAAGIGARWLVTTSGTSEGGSRADASTRSIDGWLDAGSPATDPADYLRRCGGLVILIGRFVATVRVLVWPIASAHGIGYGRFLAWDLGAAALWAAAFVPGGYAFGRPALSLMKGLGGPAFIAAGVGVSWLEVACSCGAGAAGDNQPESPDPLRSGVSEVVDADGPWSRIRRTDAKPVVPVGKAAHPLGV